VNFNPSPLPSDLAGRPSATSQPASENYAMGAIALLIICGSAQILIAAALGIYFPRRLFRQRRDKNTAPATDRAPGDKIPPD